jgi:hypothetical protein
VQVRVRDPFEPSFTDVTTFTIQVIDPDGAFHFVRALYHALLHREAETAGLDGWVGLLRSGASRQQIAQGIWQSLEHRGLQVDEFYVTYLHRTADAAGRTGWVSALLGGMSEAEVARGFLTSEEYLQAHASTTAYLFGLYADVLGRVPDPDGLAGWQQAAQGGMSREALAEGLLTSHEEDVQLVARYYADYLGRAGEPAGVAGWVAALQDGQLSPAQVAQAFLACDEFAATAVP